MPHIPDSNHPTHDLELVAAFAAGDMTGADLESATALVATCTECATLAADLRAITLAMPELPVPVRRLDFRLTPEQAASLKGPWWRRIAGAFASPKLSFATPLGTGLAALGIVGVLVATGGIPAGGATGGATAGQAEATAGVDTMITLEASAGASAAAASAAPEAPREGALTGPADASPAASMADGEIAGEQPVSGAAAASSAPLSEPYGAASIDPAGGAAANVPPVAPEPSAVARIDAPSPVDAKRAPDETLLIVAAMAVMVGVALVALRFLSRRLT